jgi:hypothetical protein
MGTKPLLKGLNDIKVYFLAGKLLIVYKFNYIEVLLFRLVR